MWFRFPVGYSGITVEQQSFTPEAADNNGRNYFRAPDHFAPRILQIKGFELAEPPDGAPDDLPRADPLRDGAIAGLTAEMQALKLENQNLRSDLNTGNARLIAMTNEKVELESKLDLANGTIEGLQEKIEDQFAADTTTSKKNK
jgi:hypothetical protein